MNMLLLVGSIVICSACSEYVQDDYTDDSINQAQMIACDYLSEGNSNQSQTRSILTPYESGTHFSWDTGDVVAVYSNANGMTNFNIDANSISADGKSATFNGAGFKLKASSTYYAFYPYSASNLDPHKVYVNFNTQKMQSNGSFKELGNFDYMLASGTTDEDGNVSFNFEHIGCVVDFKLSVPETANYSQVLFELEQNGENATLIKNGFVDLTSSAPTIKAAASDTLMKVKLCSDDGIEIKKDSILHVYMMMAPQDLSAYQMTVKLVDTDNKWYSAKVYGKNMKAGYTYHYVIAEDSKDGGFTGSGIGLPDASSYSLISTYRHQTAVPYYDFFVENNFLYAACETGIRKLDYTIESSPDLVLENNIAPSNLCLMSRSVTSTSNKDYLYVGLRQNSSGDREKFVPEISQSFETNITNVPNQQLTDNSTVNAFFSNLNLSVDLCKVASVVVCKAYKKSENNYVNAIIFKVSGDSDYNLYSSSYSSKVDALASLPNHIEKSNGDFCDVDWSAISEGNQTLHMRFNFFTSLNVSSKLATMMQITNNPCPGYGLNSGLFALEGSSNNMAGLLTYMLSNSRAEGEASFWIKVDNDIQGTVYMPIFTNSSSNVFSVTLKPKENGYGIAIENTLPNKTFSFGKWYNIKATYENGKKSIFYREPECGAWNLITITTTSPSTYNRVSIGVSGKNTKAAVYVDEFRYKQNNLDDFSYIKGKISILDKKDLSIKKILNLDYKVTGIGAKDDVLVVNCLNAINIYDIYSPLEPKLVYTYRPKSFRDIQDVTFFEKDGQSYAMSCKYNKGVIIFDITDVNNVQVVADDEFADLQYNGKSGILNHFSAVVDYPYAYLTMAPIPTQINTIREATGILMLDLSNFKSITKKMYKIPLQDITAFGNGDPTPTNIVKYRNRLYVNNREKGIAVFKIESPGNITYDGIINVADASINCIEITSDGRMFLGDDNGCGDNRNINLIRFE